nr:tRNA pseudouridine(55) synthase TruB [Paracoccaceae bacterium]
ALAGLPELRAAPAAADALRHGNPAFLSAPGLAEGAKAWASADGLPLAVGVWQAGVLRPERVFVFD